jgi:hypothetical protein
MAKLLTAAGATRTSQPSSGSRAAPSSGTCGGACKTAGFRPIGMEQLWNRGGATGRKRSARQTPINGLNERETVATGCHRLPFGSHGKEGVDGSSPSEGSAKTPHVGASRSDPVARSPACIRYGAVYGAFRFRMPLGVATQRREPGPPGLELEPRSARAPLARPQRLLDVDIAASERPRAAVAGPGLDREGIGASARERPGRGLAMTHSSLQGT